MIVGIAAFLVELCNILFSETDCEFAFLWLIKIIRRMCFCAVPAAAAIARPTVH